MYGVPFTSEDLRRIADAVEIAENSIGGFLTDDGDIAHADIADVIVKISRPDDDEVVGEFRHHGDGWFGYYPYDVEGSR